MTDCYCDRNNIGVPGVSCGDCPERDYKKSRDKAKSIGLLCAELKANGEDEAAFVIDRVAYANAELSEVNVELLEALDLILETVPPYKEDGTCTIPDDTIEAVNQAIAKAKGETE